MNAPVRQNFRVLLVDLTTRRTHIETLEGRETYLGGSGLAELLFEKYVSPNSPWSDPA